MRVIKIADTVTEWMLYSVVLSFLPIGIHMLLSHLYNLKINEIQITSDLLLLSIILTITIMKDIISYKLKKIHALNSIFFFIFILNVLSAVLYGLINFSQGIGYNYSYDILYKLRWYSIFIFLFSLVTGLFVQILGGLQNG